MKKLTPRELAYAVDVAVTCGISYAMISQVLVRFADRPDRVLGGMWAVAATIFVFRKSRERSLSAGGARLVATGVSFALCLVYLLIFAFTPLGMIAVIGAGTIVMMLPGRRDDIDTAAITTAVVLVVAATSPERRDL